MPLYSSMHSLARGEAVRRCTAASAGDVVLTLAAFAVVAASARSRRWLLWRRATHIAGYLAVGLAVTIVVEVLAVRSWGRWSYDPRMPRLLGVGLAPLAQWIVVPLATLWVARYYLDGVAHRRAARRV